MSNPKIDTLQNSITMASIHSKALEIARLYNPLKIILFGSYASGNPTPDSDVDFLVIMDSQTSNLDLAVDISLSLTHTFPMDIIVRTPEEIAKRLRYGDFFIKDIMENGKILYERID